MEVTGNTIFVSNLPPNVSQDEVKHFFSEHGFIKRIHLPTMKGEDKNKKSIAFIKFQLALDAENAINSLNGALFNGKKMIVEPAKRRVKSEKANKLREKQQQLQDTLLDQDRRTIIVRNLPFKRYPRELVPELQKVFGRFGAIETAKVPKPKDKRLKTHPHEKNAGFGFVRYKSIESANKAVKANMSKVFGREVVVDKCRAQTTEEKKKQKEQHKRILEQQENSDEEEGDEDSEDEDETSDEEESESEDESNSNKEEDDNKAEDSDDSAQWVSDNEDSDHEETEIDDLDAGLNEDDENEDDENEKPTDYSQNDADFEIFSENENDANDDDETSSVDSVTSDTLREERERIIAHRRQGKPQEEKSQDEKRQEELERTAFVTDIPTTVDQPTIKKKFSKFGNIQAVLMVQNKVTGEFKGSAFVIFRTKNGLENLFTQREKFEALCETPELKNQFITIDNAPIRVFKAAPKNEMKPKTREDKKRVRREKKGKTNRYLYLTDEGRIYKETPAAQGLTPQTLKHIEKLFQNKWHKLKSSTNFSVSPTRLCVRWFPWKMDKQEMRQLFLHTAQEVEWKYGPPKIKEVSMVKKNKWKNHQGFRDVAFVEFDKHEHALYCLRKLNNNPRFKAGKGRRILIDFAVENANALKKLREIKEAQKRKTELRKQQDPQFRAKIERKKAILRRKKELKKLRKKRKEEKLKEQREQLQSSDQPKKPDTKKRKAPPNHDHPPKKKTKTK